VANSAISSNKPSMNEDFALSSARLQFFLPIYGRFTEIELPFLTWDKLDA
jgi:hypothetical protein